MPRHQNPKKKAVENPPLKKFVLFKVRISEQPATLASGIRISVTYLFNSNHRARNKNSLITEG